MPVQTEVRPDLLTGEELLEKSDVGPSELVEGRIVPTGYTNRKHARIVLLLGYELESFVREQSVAGKVFVGDAGLYTERDPDTVRGVDVASSPRSAWRKTPLATCSTWVPSWSSKSSRPRTAGRAYAARSANTSPSAPSGSGSWSRPTVACSFSVRRIRCGHSGATTGWKAKARSTASRCRSRRSSKRSTRPLLRRRFCRVALRGLFPARWLKRYGSPIISAPADRGAEPKGTWTIRESIMRLVKPRPLRPRAGGGAASSAGGGIGCHSSTGRSKEAVGSGTRGKATRVFLTLCSPPVRRHAAPLTGRAFARPELPFLRWFKQGPVLPPAMQREAPAVRRPPSNRP